MELWLAAEDRMADTNAANYVDQQLARDPFSRGEEVETNAFEWEVAPLKIGFEIRPDDRIVEVLIVRALNDG